MFSLDQMHFCRAIGTGAHALRLGCSDAMRPAWPEAARSRCRRTVATVCGRAAGVWHVSCAGPVCFGRLGAQCATVLRCPPPLHPPNRPLPTPLPLCSCRHHEEG